MNKEIQATRGNEVSVKAAELGHKAGLGSAGVGIADMKDVLAKEQTGSGKGAEGMLKCIPLEITESPKGGGGGGKISHEKSDGSKQASPSKRLEY
jgi:hypothetical protein